MSQAVIDLITETPRKIALRGIRVHSRLTAMGQRTTVEQSFVNLEEEAIEVTYTFPLPERTAVCGFEVITGDRVLTGQIEKAEKASELYEQAIGRGDAAYSLRQHRPDVFSIDVGNIKPGQVALVRITYVSELEVVDGKVRLAYPTVVAPRYATATATDPLDALVDAHALNPPHVLQVPYGLSLEAEVSLGRTIRSIHSPSHSITVQNTGEQDYAVTLEGGLTETNREIVLELELGQEQQPQAESVIGPDGRAYAAVTFLPELDGVDAPEASEVVFVVDCSGSMGGSSIGQAKLALDLCLRHLSDGDSFNVLLFGSTFKWMSPEPLAYSQATLEGALRYVGEIDANLGGTELYPPLASFVGRKPCVGTARQVILLTDGEVSNEPAIIALARKHRASNRFFTFGIGPACSRHLVRQLAETTRGAVEFIGEGERIAEKVLRTFSRLATPNMTDLAVRWGEGARVEQSPKEIPPIFDGDALVLYARGPDDRLGSPNANQCVWGPLPSDVTLKCHTAAGAESWTVAIPRPTRKDETLPLLWARRTIESLEDAGEDSKAALIAISKQFGLLCQHTSFIAVEHRSPEERNEGCPATRRVPVQIPRGWHGIQAASTLKSLSVDMDACDDGVMDVCAEFDRVGPLSAAPEPAQLGAVLQKQQADGSFEALDESIVGWRSARRKAETWIAAHPIAASCEGGSQAATDRGLGALDRVTATLAVMILLYRDFERQETLWWRAGLKARSYLSNALGIQGIALRVIIGDLATT